MSTAMDYKRLLKLERQKLFQQQAPKGGGATGSGKEENRKGSGSSRGISFEKDDSHQQQRPDNAVSLSSVDFPPFHLSAGQSINLEEFKVGCIPNVYYVPNFLTDQDEANILEQVYAVPETHSQWEKLRTRRLQCWGGNPTTNSFKLEPLPPWLHMLCQDLVDRKALSEVCETPNHALLNLYEAGIGIMPHTDGPYYHAKTATVSLCSDALMSFSQRLPSSEIGGVGFQSVNGTSFSLILRRKGLVVFSDEAYTSYLHGISDHTENVVGGGGIPCVNLELAKGHYGMVIQRGERISLTLRRVKENLNG